MPLWKFFLSCDCRFTWCWNKHTHTHTQPTIGPPPLRLETCALQQQRHCWRPSASDAVASGKHTVEAWTPIFFSNQVLPPWPQCGFGFCSRTIKRKSDRQGEWPATCSEAHSACDPVSLTWTTMSGQNHKAAPPPWLLRYLCVCEFLCL